MWGLGAGTGRRRHRTPPTGEWPAVVDEPAGDVLVGHRASDEVDDLVRDLRTRGLTVEVMDEVGRELGESGLLAHALGSVRSCAPSTRVTLSACEAGGCRLMCVLINRYDPKVLALWSLLRRDGVEIRTDYRGFVSLQQYTLQGHRPQYR